MRTSNLCNRGVEGDMRKWGRMENWEGMVPMRKGKERPSRKHSQ